MKPDRLRGIDIDGVLLLLVSLPSVAKAPDSHTRNAMATPSNLRFAILLPGHQSLDVVGAMDYLNDHISLCTSQNSNRPAPPRFLTWYFVSNTLEPPRAQNDS